MDPSVGFTPDRMAKREEEIAAVAKSYRFAAVHQGWFPTTRLDSVPRAEIISKVARIVDEVKPEIIYLPFSGDVHTDHRVVFESVAACTKWFRHGSVRRVLAYETLSETEFGISPESLSFRPNVFVDVSAHLEKKIQAMRLYAGEMGTFPFPRSEEAIRALAAVRGAAVGCAAAEAFILLREIL